MPKHEIIEEIELLGFPYLATLLDSNEITYLDALNHILNCFYETTEEEFAAADYEKVELLLQDYFDFKPTNQPTK